MRSLKYFWKLSILMVIRYLGEHLRTSCVQKKFYWSLKILKKNLVNFVQKWPFLTFPVLVVKDQVTLDKNVKNFSLYQK